VTADSFLREGFFDPRDLVQVKYEMLRRVRVEGQSVASSAAASGLSRPTYYEAQGAFAREGLPGLLPRRRGPRHGHKVRDEVLRFLVAERSGEDRPGARELARRVQERFGVRVHPRTIERALARWGKAGR
jgi:transposase